METNPGPRRPVPDVCRILCSNVQGLAGNLGDLTDDMVLLLDFGLRYESRVGVAGSRIWSPCLGVLLQDASGPMDCGIHTR